MVQVCGNIVLSYCYLRALVWVFALVFFQDELAHFWLPLVVLVLVTIDLGFEFLVKFDISVGHLLEDSLAIRKVNLLRSKDVCFIYLVPYSHHYLILFVLLVLV